MNLPNTLTLGRILITPLVALLPFAGPWQLKFTGFVLYVLAAVTDYFDGMLARTRNLITDLGKLLDPLADKLLLVGTMIPMYILMTDPGDWPAGHLPLIVNRVDAAFNYQFQTPLGAVHLPFWIVAVVLGRELFMTIFRQIAAKRGVVIAAIGPAKWKTAMQSIWVGAAYFWIAALATATQLHWENPWWSGFANFNGIVGVVSMVAAFVLTLYSLVLYLQQYGHVVFRTSTR
ncbi:MAG: CDP-alcohol phosphatidyltransferase family protein [Gemmatimonadota bacterium]|nr:CDP-alcohol phosphatidyltransferase family protein [Gemmatimonadota bacterium]